MRFDVSELKTLTECSRKWQLSSRNAYHLKPRFINNNLAFGSLFHECLHAMYLGGDIGKIIAQAKRECVDEVQRRVIENMLTGYYTQVYSKDKKHYQVLDIEHSVNFYVLEMLHIDDLSIDEENSIQVCGSIDMICLDTRDNKIYGFEHKTASKFRPDIYLAVDEQPRTYYIELLKFVNEYNRKHAATNSEFVPVEIGGIFINEVKKNQRNFEYCRRLCKYSEAEIRKFKHKLQDVGLRIQRLRRGEEEPELEPSYMGCQMCDYQAICQLYGYNDLDKSTVLEEFQEEFEVREVDHLDEKLERRIQG